MVNGEMVRLTYEEYRLLALLVQHAGVVVTRPILLMQIWGYGPEIREHKLGTCIRGLRKRLGVYADHIETVHETGYRFRPLGSRCFSRSRRPAAPAPVALAAFAAVLVTASFSPSQWRGDASRYGMPSWPAGIESLKQFPRVSDSKPQVTEDGS